MPEPVKIMIYRWAGEKWFFRIGSECVECDLAVAQVKRLLAAHPDWRVDVKSKPWLTHLWASLWHGGWHAPVVLVDGRLLRQGSVPSYVELEARVHSALQKRQAGTNSASSPYPPEARFRVPPQAPGAPRPSEAVIPPRLT